MLGAEVLSGVVGTATATTLAASLLALALAAALAADAAWSRVAYHRERGRADLWRRAWASAAHSPGQGPAGLASALTMPLGGTTDERRGELDETRDELLTAVFHELRTPLTSVTGYLETLMEGDAGPLNDEQRAMLAAIDRNARRLRVLLDDLLTLAQAESSTWQHPRRAVNFGEITAEAVADARIASGRTGVEIDWCPPDVPVIVNGDADQLNRVVTNLLSNGVKFTPSGGRVRVTLAGEFGGQSRLTVADTGIGIPAAEQAHLFRRFFRASNATGRAIQGTGLGLTIVRAIVARHGGEFDVDSAEDQGTTITVRLPAVTAL